MQCKIDIKKDNIKSNSLFQTMDASKIRCSKMVGSEYIKAISKEEYLKQFGDN